MVTVTFDPSDQSFSYSGDIHPTTEEILVQGTLVCTIGLTVEGATWASPPIKWVTPSKQAMPTPTHMTVTVVDEKNIQITDDCHEASAGSFAFLVCVNNNGTNVCSDPSIKNEPGGGSP
jgi:hypothetical protein